MKKKLGALMTAVLVFAVACFALACNDGLKTLTLNKTSAEIEIGGTVQLSANEDYAAAGLTGAWTSGNDTHATVSEDGLVTGITAGTATITLTLSNGLTASCEVTVLTAEETAPVITLGAASASVNYATTKKYILNYSVAANPAAEITVTCDKTSGFTVAANKKDITFSAEGTYVFTIKATNSLGSDTKTVTLEVYTEVEPVITLNSAAEATVNIVDSVVFDYTLNTAYPVASFNLTCDKAEGWAYDAGTKTLTFTVADTFVFTLTYANSKASDSETVTVTVMQSAAPALVLTSEPVTTLDLDIDAPEYVISYSGANVYPLPVFTLTCEGDSENDITDEGYSYNAATRKIIFYRPGEYNFTLSAENSEGESSVDFTVTATAISRKTLVDENFDDNQTPASATVDATKVTFENEEMHIIASSTAGASFAFAGAKTYAVQEAVVLAAEGTFRTDSGSTAMLFNFRNVESQVAAVFYSGGRLNYRNASVTAWTEIPDTAIAIGQNYHIKMVLNVKTQMYTLYLDGVEKGTYDIREKAMPISNINFYTNDTGGAGGNFYIDDLQVYELRTLELDVNTSAYTVENDGDTVVALDYTSRGFGAYAQNTETTVTYVSGPRVYAVSNNALVSYTIDNLTQITIGANGTYTFDITVSNAFATVTEQITITATGFATPTLTITGNSYHTVFSGGTATQEFNYTAAGHDSIAIECVEASNWSVAGNNTTVTFTAVGTYTFTVKAIKDGVYVKGGIEVVVKEAVAPAITLSSDAAANADLGWNPEYTLEYSINEDAYPVPAVTLTCAGKTENTDYTYDQASGKIIFLTAGSFVFTLTATNDGGADTEIITVTVVDSRVMLINENFDDNTKPANATTDASKVTFEGGEMHITASSATGASFSFAGSKSYAVQESATLVAEGNFRATSGSTAMIFNFRNGTSQVISLFYSAGKLNYRTGTDSAWMEIPGTQIALNQDYHIKMILNIKTQVYTIYLNGIEKGSYNFRDKTKAIDNVQFYSDNAGGNIYIDNLMVYELKTLELEVTTSVYTVTSSSETEKEVALGYTFNGFGAYTSSTQAAVMFVSGPALYNNLNEMIAYTIDDLTHITIRENGTYKFDITVSNAFTSKTQQITITASGFDTPTLTINESAQTVTLSGGTVDATLDYTASADDITVECDQVSGFSIAGDNVTATFTAEEIYVLTITVTKGDIYVMGIITVTVKSPVAPVLTLTSAAAATVHLDLAPVYTVAYSLNGNVFPAPDMVLTCVGGTENTDYTYNSATGKITFINAGEYNFTLTATNEVAGDSETFAVTVVGWHNILLDVNFDSNANPDSTNADFFIVTTSVKFQNQEMYFSASGNTGARFMLPSSYSVQQEAIVVAEAKFKPENSNGALLFSFRFGTGINDQVASLYCKGGKLYYNADTGTNEISGVQINNGTSYHIKMALNVEAQTYTVYLEGSEIGTFAFKNTTQSITNIHFASYVNDSKFSIDDFKVYEVFMTDPTPAP